MKLYLAYRYADAINELNQVPNEYRLTSDQATRIKAIMDRTAQDIKRVTGSNPIALDANVNGIVFVRSYTPEQQILVQE